MGNFLPREITRALLGISVYSLVSYEGEFRPTEKGQLSEVRMSVIREMQRKERKACQVNASLGGSWCQPSLSQELTEPISRQKDPTLQAELKPTRTACHSAREPEASGHIVGSCHQARFKRASRSSNTMPDQEACMDAIFFRRGRFCRLVLMIIRVLLSTYYVAVYKYTN